MKKKYRTGPNLFFIEFITALFFFLIVSTVCVRVFVRAHLTTLNAEALSCAQTAASSVAEIIEENGVKEQALLAFFPEMRKEDGCFFLSYDRHFQTCRPEDAFYTLTLRPEQDGRTDKAGISVTDIKNQPVYELSVQFYRPLTREEVLS